MYHFDWSVLWGESGIRMLDGLYVTVKLVSLTLAFALCIGVVVGTARWLGKWYIEPVCWVYIESARNTPPLVQILFWYFSASYLLPQPIFMYMRNAGYEFAAAVVALSIYHGAFVAETIRAGLNSVSQGQIQAARALGLNFGQRMVHVILPQALRVSVPPIVNEMVGATKNTSLAMAIGVTEIAYQTKYIETYNFRGVEALVGATALYLFVCLAITAIAPVANKLLSRHMLPARPLPQPLLSE
jgi:polar amino acid transport system permease protein